MVTIDAIVLGAGLGTRFAESVSPIDAQIPKQFQLLNGIPVFIHGLRALLTIAELRSIVVTAPKAHLKIADRQLSEYLTPTQRAKIRLIGGGERRQDSSRLAFEALDELNPLPTRVLIHDACRPFLSEELLSQVQKCLLDRSYGAWVPVVPVVETLKKIENQQVVETVDRSLVHRVQTPQVFEYTLVRSLVDRVKDFPELNFTDDASLCEYYGIPVGAFEGDVRNVKLTYSFELESLRLWMAQEKRGRDKDETHSTDLSPS